MARTETSFSAAYRKKLVEADDAVAPIHNNDLVVIGLGAAQPLALTWALANRARSGGLDQVRVFTAASSPTLADSILAPDLCDVVRHLTMFVGAADRGLVRAGLTQFLPCHFHQVPRLLTEVIGVDVAMAVVSPMDEDGYFSFGASNDVTGPAMRSARRALVEVNEFMPRVGGDSRIHVSEVEAIVECDAPFPAYPAYEPEPGDGAIADLIAERVPDGATLQIGVGMIPDLVCGRLADRRDLGIHTEMLSEGLVDLVLSGAVTGARKSLHAGKHVFTIAGGGERVFEALRTNPDFESHPVSYTNHPSVIARNERMVSINSILEIDLLGQANAEFLRGHQFSGSGGQLDFVRGAYDSRDGISALAFHATARDGTISRIVPRLPAGAMVTTPRNDTHLVVTEYGIADLKGKTLGERALALIDIAHPRFRDELTRAAEEMALF